MDSNIEITIGDDGLPQQSFNGKTYKLYQGERYFSRGCKRMHVSVWEVYNGKIEKGFHVHHKDKNRWNNKIENLALKERAIHQREHFQERRKENPEFFVNLQKIGEQKAREWHGSEEGREWHKVHAKNNTAFVHTKDIERQCECCGGKYMSCILQQKTARFCSNKCKSKWRRKQGVDSIERQCANCSKLFKTSKFSKATHCSIKCAKNNKK